MLLSAPGGRWVDETSPAASPIPALVVPQSWWRSRAGEGWGVAAIPLSPSVFASCLVFLLSVDPLCKESSGTQTPMLDLNFVLFHRSQKQLLGVNGVWKTPKAWQDQAQWQGKAVLKTKQKETQGSYYSMVQLLLFFRKTPINISLLIFLIPSVANCQQRYETQNPVHEHSVRRRPRPRTPSLSHPVSPHPFPSTHCMASRISHGNNPMACFPLQVNTGFKAVIFFFLTCRPSHYDYQSFLLKSYLR